MLREYELVTDGVPVTASFSDEAVDKVFVPLLRHWAALRDERGGRVVAFLSAPPGTGKTTLATFLEWLSRSRAGLSPVRSLPLDGFHYHQRHLESHRAEVQGRVVRLAEVKGTLETYDLPRLSAKFDELRRADRLLWPAYSRRSHDVVDDALEVTGDIALVEGNWLLSSEGEWSDLRLRCDDSVFVSADEPLLRGRLIARKLRGGLSPEAAERWYETSDGANVRRLLANHHPGRLNLRLTDDGDYVEA